MTNHKALPKDLAPFVLEYRGPGIVLRPARIGSSGGGGRLSIQRLDELTEEGWLTKSVRGWSADGEEELEVEQDENGDWWYVDYGQRCHERDLAISYLTTEQAHATEEALQEQLDRDMDKLAADAANAYESARKIQRMFPTKNSGVLDVREKAQVRAELAFLALTAEAPLVLLESYRTQLKDRGK